jgi:tRNA nucleotidyltransferase (CCA-adding enzyme)
MKILLVGGAVRDELLNYPYEERDWVVVGGTPEDMLKEGFRPVGKDFPVFIHPKTGEEYALARTERKTGHGYKGFTFHTDSFVTLEEDLKRRDLTINAIAKDENGNIIDPYHGQSDIENKQLKHVSEAFAEDPVRILRVARFRARYHHLGFSTATTTLDLMKSMVAAGETQHLVSERVWQECEKALGEKNPEQFFISLHECNAIQDIFPELKDRVMDDCLENLKKVTAISQSKHQRFAALCYSLSEQEIRTLHERLGLPNQYYQLSQLIQQHQRSVRSCTARSNLEAQQIASTLQSLDVIRKPERFIQVIEVIAWLSESSARSKIISFWQEAARYYQQVNPQALIRQGYSKSELGKAIHSARIEQLSNFLKS